MGTWRKYTLLEDLARAPLLPFHSSHWCPDSVSPGNPLEWSAKPSAIHKPRDSHGLDLEEHHCSVCGLRQHPRSGPDTLRVGSHPPCSAGADGRRQRLLGDAPRSHLILRGHPLRVLAQWRHVRTEGGAHARRPAPLAIPGDGASYRSWIFARSSAHLLQRDPCRTATSSNTSSCTWETGRCKGAIPCRTALRSRDACSRACPGILRAKARCRGRGGKAARCDAFDARYPGSRRGVAAAAGSNSCEAPTSRRTRQGLEGGTPSSRRGGGAGSFALC